MNFTSIMTVFVVPAILLVCPSATPAQELRPIQLVRPHTKGGKPLMEALKERKSSREFNPKTVPLEVLSNVLWAGFGVNRPESGKRTAPSAMNWQEIDIYVATAEALYLFDADAHMLRPIVAEDIRALTGAQPFVEEAPINLIYVADFSKMGMATPSDKDFYSATDTGFISQNVYLYCASEGLATVVRGLIDRPALAKAMGLRPDQKIILAQSVGYPKQ